jgi:NDP-sugar pyrophosphorylase family protein
VFYSKSAQPGEADYIDYGLSAFSRTVFEGYRNAPMPLDLGLVQERLVREGQMAACIVHERFYEIGKPEGLAELDRLLAHKG